MIGHAEDNRQRSVWVLDRFRSGRRLVGGGRGGAHGVNPVFPARGEPLLQGFGGGLATGGEQGGEELILEFPASAVDDLHVGHGGLAY